MSVSRQFVERAAAETGFQLVAIEKVVRLGEVAADIGRHPFLGDVLVLKGGTALNLAFGSMARMSVDLDFNYIGHLDREGMLADRPKVEAAVTDLARSGGYVVQGSADAHAGRKLYFTYQSALGPKDRIEVDLNFLFRQPIGDPEIRTLWQPGGLDRPSVKTVSLDELLIGKFLALLDRAAARDAWDTANLTLEAKRAVKSPSFRRRFLAMAAVLTHPLSEYTYERLARIVTDRVVEEQLDPMLGMGASPPADALCSGAWRTISPLIELTEAEQQYFNEIQLGNLRLDLLFGPDSPEGAQLAQHPALLWKIANVKKHLSRSTRRQSS